MPIENGRASARGLMALLNLDASSRRGRFIAALLGPDAPADVVTQCGLDTMSAAELARWTTEQHLAALGSLGALDAAPAIIAATALTLAERVAAIQAAAYEREISSLCHDLRSPLTAICGALNVIENSPPEAVPAMAALAMKGIDRLEARLDAMNERAAAVGEEGLALVCEPNPAMRDILHLWLGQANFDVLDVATAAEASEASQRPPAVALVAVERVEALQPLPARTPVIVMGGSPPAAPGQLILPRPFKKAELLDALRRARGGQA